MTEDLRTVILPGTADSDYERYLRSDEWLALLAAEQNCSDFTYPFVCSPIQAFVIITLPSGSNSVVECDLAKVEVAGSNPVSRSRICRPRAARGFFAQSATAR